MNALYSEYPFMTFSEFNWIFVVVIIAIAIFLFQSRRKKARRTAKEILDEKYAQGKIDFKEYEEKSKGLEK